MGSSDRSEAREIASRLPPSGTGSYDKLAP